MIIKYDEVIKKFAEKNCIKENDAKKIFSRIEEFIIEYLSDVNLDEENVIFPINGLRLSSRKVARKNSMNDNGETIVVNATFNHRFRDRLNRKENNLNNLLWFL